jgi:hypothetical protein
MYNLNIYPPVKKIISFGDIHGDFNLLISLLNLNKLINNNYNWIGKKTFLVQVGDLFDRGGRSEMYKDENSEFKIINFLIKLKSEAFASGGNVILLLGNHELMNFQGIFNYVSNMGFNNFNSIKDRKQYLKPGNKFCLKIANNFKCIVKIGNIVFVHAGINYNISKKYNINYINSLMYSYLLGNINISKSKQFKELFIHNSSILWFRGWGNSSINSEKLLLTLDNLNAKYLVIGHTPQESISFRCNKKLWRIDTGMSYAFGKRDNIQSLSIINNGKQFLINKLKIN